MATFDNVSGVQLWLNRRRGPILDQVVQGIRAKGLRVTRDLNHPKNMLVIEDGKIRAVWDLTNTLQTIATLPDGSFDRRLATNSAYEMIKVQTILAEQLQVIFALFFTLTEQDRMDKFREISTSGGLSIQVYRR